MWRQFLIGLGAGVGIAWLAFRTRSLDQSGMVVAAILGTIVFGLGGVAWAVVLLTFFITSSGLSHFFRSRKNAAGLDFAKGSRRDAGQVVANGGVAGVLTLTFFILSMFSPGNRLTPILWVGFAASLAAANADTWATELGILNPIRPVLITTFKQVPKGTSGGISLVGTLAALAGSTLVAGVAVLGVRLGWVPGSGIGLVWQFVIISLAGLLGALVDSVLGATIQVIYYCPHCHKETERHPLHSCGTQTVRKRGLAWLNNDWVNAACTVSTAIVGMLLKLFV
jgi:uncharacterized protein (TIGR00297 family)